MLAQTYLAANRQEGIFQRQAFLPIHLLFLTPLLGSVGPVAGDVEFQDDPVVHRAIYGCGGGREVGDDLLPLGEDRVGRDAQGPALIPHDYERE